MSPLLVVLPDDADHSTPIIPSENISDNVIYKMSFDTNVYITQNTASSGSKAAQQSDDSNSSDSMSKIVINAIYYDNTDKNWYYQQSSSGNVVYKDFSSMKVVVTPSDHYTFKGYYTGENGKGTQIIDGNGLLNNNASVTKAGTLYKYEIADSWDIEYVLNGGTNYANAPTEYSYGTSTTIDGTPTRANSTFDGWCDDAELTQSCATTRTIFDTDPGDKTFYAKWSCNENYHASEDGKSCVADTVYTGSLDKTLTIEGKSVNTVYYNYTKSQWFVKISGENKEYKSGEDGVDVSDLPTINNGGFKCFVAQGDINECLINESGYPVEGKKLKVNTNLIATFRCDEGYEMSNGVCVEISCDRDHPDACDTQDKCDSAQGTWNGGGHCRTCGCTFPGD